jgi:hypothetical protein
VFVIFGFVRVLVEINRALARQSGIITQLLHVSGEKRQVL